jgi:MHS family proline/betaine transporter-like MFS transporter
MPSVDSDEAARELVATQDRNPLPEMDTLPFDSSYEAARGRIRESPSIRR